MEHQNYEEGSDNDNFSSLLLHRVIINFSSLFAAGDIKFTIVSRNIFTIFVEIRNIPKIRLPNFVEKNFLGGAL